MTSQDIATYQLQIQQVEAALIANPNNVELLKLKEDLQQVINLTKNILAAQVANFNDKSQEPEPKKPNTSTLTENSTVKTGLTPIKHWQVGEQCQALWPKNGQYFEAKIQEITTEGEVQIIYKHNRQQGLTCLGLLKFSKHGMTASKQQSEKERIEKQREYLKKKKAKKIERFRQADKEREQEKNKWQNFSNKAFGKKGFAKKSIFKTRDSESVSNKTDLNKVQRLRRGGY